ncbi:MAG: GNAT family N-acetyltransferase [Chloroflexota bacterium]
MDALPLALHPPDPAIAIRPAKLDDLEALMDCCWTDRRRDVGLWLLERAIRNRRDGRGAGVVVLGSAAQPIGYGQLTLWPRCAEISDLVIAPPYRDQGYGTALVQHLMAEAVRLKASCVEIGAAVSNPRATALYHRLGFVDNRTIQMNLGGPSREPVVYMTIQLPTDG